METAEEGAAAVAMYREAMEGGAPFDLVIMDLTIPGGMGGEEAVQEILKIDPNVRAIVSSGYSTDPIMARFREYGFCATMTKPYKLQEIAAVIERVLG